MLFNSRAFVAFFFCVYAGYLLLQGRLRAQNILLLIAGWTFYGFWDWRFLGLLIFSTALDFFLALRIEHARTDTIRKRLLAVSMVASLSLLAVFKYFNFFADSATELLRMIGFDPGFVTLNVVLPLGISFYTFQTMSYTIDVYRGRLAATRHFVDFAVFVCFFPHLVAGPIQRAVSLLPQVARPRQISLAQVNVGLGLLAWGYVKKVAIADNVGPIADRIFDGYTHYQGLDLLLGVAAFTVQIYCDFSGYSDIARGLAKLLGFELMVNFHFPYFAINPSDFWSRWHVSLSTWLREYLYIPLGGNQHGSWRTFRNLLVTMVLGGLWHGAAWNFVIWGAYHGVLLSAYRGVEFLRGERAPAARHMMMRVGQRLLMLVLVTFGWLLFRARSVDQIIYMVTHAGWQPSDTSAGFAMDLLFFAGMLPLLEIWLFTTNDAIAMTKLPVIPRAFAYAAMVVWIVVVGARTSTEFIYFQF